MSLQSLVITCLTHENGRRGRGRLEMECVKRWMSRGKYRRRKGPPDICVTCKLFFLSRLSLIHLIHKWWNAWKSLGQVHESEAKGASKTKQSMEMQVVYLVILEISRQLESDS